MDLNESPNATPKDANQNRQEQFESPANHRDQDLFDEEVGYVLGLEVDTRESELTAQPILA